MNNLNTTMEKKTEQQMLQGMKNKGINGLKTVLVIILAVVSAVLVHIWGLSEECIIMIFLLGVLFTTVLTSSRGWGIGVSLLFVMLYNFLFTAPYYTFLISSTNDLLLLGFFLVTAIVSGTVTSRLQKEQERTQQNEEAAQILYHIASGFLSVSGVDNAIQKGQDYVQKYAGVSCRISTDKNPGHAAGEQIFQIKSSNGTLGSMRVNAQKLTRQQLMIIQAISTQLGITLERENLVSEGEKIRLDMEREKQRSMLLRSVAHDLRSPLTALSGAGTLLTDEYDKLTEEERKKLASDVCEEIIWLTDLVENILNMTRINEQQLAFHMEEEVIDDVVDSALAHIRRLMRDRTFKVTLPDTILTARMDAKLMSQVIVNLLENATRHTPPDAEIALQVGLKGNDILVKVSDTGEGVPAEIKNRLFERYVSLDRRIVDGKKGIGLGLAICKTIVEAHGGKIWAEDNKPHGAVFAFTIPLESKSDE